MLTRKQNELLMFINKRLNDDGVSPSFDEMKEALHLKSKSGIHRLITGLEERGFLRRLPHRARALQVLKLPDAAGDAGAETYAPLNRPGLVEGEGLCAMGGWSPAPQVANEARREPAALWPRRRRHADRGAARRRATVESRRRMREIGERCCSRCRATRWSRPASSTATSSSARAPTAPTGRDRRRPGRRRRSDAEAAAQEGRLDRAGSRQCGLRTRIFGRPGQDPGRLAGLFRRYH